MKEIPLSRGRVALIDDGDFEDVAQFKWFITVAGYAARNLRGTRGVEYMHRRIMQTPRGFETDHINQDKVDNQRHNLRIVTNIENQACKRVQNNNNSGYRGVSRNKKVSTWQAYIKVAGKGKYLGSFKTPAEAALAYNAAARLHFGNFAYINEV